MEHATPVSQPAQPPRPNEVGTQPASQTSPVVPRDAANVRNRCRIATTPEEKAAILRECHEHNARVPQDAVGNLSIYNRDVMTSAGSVAFNIYSLKRRRPHVMFGLLFYAVMRI